MKKIIVNLKENSYPIFVGHSILPQFKRSLEKYHLNKKILFITDSNVEKFHYERIKSKSSLNINEKNYLVLRPGENTKSYHELNRIYSFLLKNNYGRDTLIVSIGGGVVGDLAGYAAATFMRGVQLVHVPTTLLAAVDSSVGGKTGINFEKKKNMIGAFYQPKFVFVDADFIKTLPRKELTSGIGEIIKYAYISDQKFYSYVLENLKNIYDSKQEVIEKIIYNSVAIKASVVSLDGKETGLRKILNFGHTFAHAFETKLDFKIKHGEAVIAGIISALFLSNKIGLLDKDKLKELLHLPLKIKLSSHLKYLNNEDLVEIMMHDKKNRDEKIKFVLISDVGKIILDAEVEKKEIHFAIAEMKKVI